MAENKEQKCPLCGQDLTDTARAEKARIENLKELYKKYYEGRDYHLKRFWENSIFVWTFLMVCFTAYGILVSKFLDVKLHSDIKPYFPILSSFVCGVGFVLSVFWYKMAKASKVWYEVYENVIWEMESFNNEFHYDDKYLIHNYWSSKEGSKISSPSKIVIAIGALLIAFWISALIIGIGAGEDLFKSHNRIMTILVICIFVSLIVFGLVGILDLKSSCIRDEKSNKVYKEIIQKIHTLKLSYRYLEVKYGKYYEKDKIWLVLKKTDSNNKDIEAFKKSLENDYKSNYLIEVSYI